MRSLLAAIVGVGCVVAAAQAQEPPPDLRLACGCAQRQAKVGDVVTVKVTLTAQGGGADPARVHPLVWDLRSVSLVVNWTETLPAKQGQQPQTQKRSYRLCRIPSTRSPQPELEWKSLGAGESISGSFELPCVRVGNLRVQATYLGYEGADPMHPLASNEADLFVGADGEGKLGATFQTEKGAVEVELERERMPGTVSQFLLNARAGLYDGTKFFRAIPGAWVQGGDPDKNDGTGDTGWTIPYEVPQDGRGRSHTVGTLSVSRGSHYDTGTTQFFFCLRDLPQYDFGSGYPHAAFGFVTKGQDVLRQIGAGPVEMYPEESPFSGEQSRLVTPVTCQKVTVWVR